MLLLWNRWKKYIETQWKKNGVEQSKNGKSSTLPNTHNRSITTNIFDLFLIFSRERTPSHTQDKMTINYRMFSEERMLKLKNSLQQVNWKAIYTMMMQTNHMNYSKVPYFYLLMNIFNIRLKCFFKNWPKTVNHSKDIKLNVLKNGTEWTGIIPYLIGTSLPN